MPDLKVGDRIASTVPGRWSERRGTIEAVTWNGYTIRWDDPSGPGGDRFHAINGTNSGDWMTASLTIIGHEPVLPTHDLGGEG